MRSNGHARPSSAGMRGASVGLIAMALMAVGPTALAAPPHGEGGHTHHVDTGNGDCVPINAVAFHAEDRGLHQGANASGAAQGPWHGPCS